MYNVAVALVNVAVPVVVLETVNAVVLTVATVKVPLYPAGLTPATTTVWPGTKLWAEV